MVSSQGSQEPRFLEGTPYFLEGTSLSQGGQVSGILARFDFGGVRFDPYWPGSSLAIFFSRPRGPLAFPRGNLTGQVWPGLTDTGQV